MAIPLVSGLEAFFSCRDAGIRGICISALARIVFENAKVFLEEDHLAAVWNLYFSLGSIASISKVFPDRIVIIKGLGLLAPVYGSVDSSLTYAIMNTLLNLENKTVFETQEIKATVQQLIERLPDLEKKAVSPQDLHPYGTGFNFFLNLLTPTNESSYDLLPWSLDTYARVAYLSSPANKEKSFPITSDRFEALEDFIKSLSNHFRASPPLVRYGASAALHTSLMICTKLGENLPSLMTFIITGCLDTDLLAAFLYLSMLQNICEGHGQNHSDAAKAKVKEIAARLRGRVADDTITYEMLHFDVDQRNQARRDQIQANRTAADVADVVTLGDVLDAASALAPPVAPKFLAKLVSSFEYLPKTLKLRQLEIVRIWGAKSEKLDANLIQALFPLLLNVDEDIQIATIKVVKALIRRLTTANAADVAYAWSFLQDLMQPGTASPLMCSVLDLIRAFPIDRLTDETKEDLLSSLLKSIFHPNPDVRLRVYDIIGSSSEFWKASGLWGSALAILFLAIGDQNHECARKTITLICVQIDKSAAMKDLIVPLSLIRDSLGKSLPATIKAYDDLANAILKEKVKLTELIEFLTLETNADMFWDFFLEGIEDNKLVRPDDYGYTRNFVHAPFWISILLVKLCMTPPPLTDSDMDRRDLMPTTPANKRRFICGFMLCLLPTCGMPDPIFRQSGLEILRLLVRVKLSALSPAILLQFLDMSLDVAFNSPSHIVKNGALELMETFLLVFPSGVSPKLSEIRDVIRSLVTNEEPEVARTACRIYPLVFHCVSPNHAKDFHEYLTAEINLIKKGGMELNCDPMLSALSTDELSRVTVLSILALGSFQVPSSAYGIVQELLKYLNSPDHDERYASFVSITNQMQHLDAIENTTILWVLLPLYADPYKPIRVAFAKFLRKMPTKLDLTLRVLAPHTDDAFVMQTVTWEELLLDGVTLHVNMKLLGDIVSDLGKLQSVHQDNSDQLPAEDDGFNLPRISQKLMNRLKEIAKAFTTMLPTINVSQVNYHLTAIQSNKLMQGYALLVLSEFCCAYESVVTESIDLFVAGLCHDLSADKTHLIQAASLALKNVSEFSPSAFKQMLTKATLAAIPNEGELFNLFYRIDAIRDFAANKAPDFLRKYMPIITSHRFSLTKRLYAIYVCVELALMVGQDEIMRVLDALQTFVEACNDDNIVEKIHGSISKLLGVAGPKHTLFRTMLGKCRKYIKSKDVQLRLKGLQIFQIFIYHLSPEEGMNFGCTFLADSDPEVRSRAKQVLILGGLLDFAVVSLKNVKLSAGSRRGSLLESCKLPSLSKIGVTSSLASAESHVLEIPVKDLDAFNANYYASDRRKKLTSRYGLDESKFARTSAPVTMSVLEVVEARVLSFHKPSVQIMEKYRWMLNIDSTTILHECLKQYPSVADEVIAAYLTQTEVAIGIKQEDDDEPGEVVESAPDVENEIHILDVFSNLLIAYDGINADASANYLDRMRKFILACNEKATIIRERLYQELENTFYFFNEFIDVPVVSDEQYEALEALKAENQKATLEAVKSGVTDRLSALDMKKVEMDEMLENKSESLRRITILALHATSGFGVFYALSTGCAEKDIIESLDFLASMLENEHRGIRFTAVEAFLTISKIQLETAPRPDILRKIQDTISWFLDKLTDSADLYRRKADYISVVSQLLPHVNDSFVVIKVLILLVKFWKDPDNEVRVIAIKMVRMLGELGIPQVMECFKSDAKASFGNKPALMPELTGLLANPEYLEKDGLQELLTWRFSQR
ncbi:armadillo-type protein [Chytriomyces sp. MP71]|nr:armadillo-type protein [Chytriomyces sp. MP71]